MNSALPPSPLSSTVPFPRDWEHTAWEAFARRMVQFRHGADNVQDVPDTVHGDAGIDLITADGCCYQCYAPEQSSDVAKAASAMKRKAATDLKKLINNAPTISALLHSIKLKRWILLCPFLDDKSVIAHLRLTSKKIADAPLDFLHRDFQSLIQSPADFENQLTKMRMESIGVPMRIPTLSSATIDRHYQQLDDRLDTKIARGFPDLTDDSRNLQKLAFVRAHLNTENLLHQMQVESPRLWESYWHLIHAEEDRLLALRLRPGAPAVQLYSELDDLKQQLSTIFESFEPAALSTIAHGTLTNWLIQCSIDFPEPFEYDR